MGAGAFLSWFSCKVNKSFCGVNIVGEYLVDFFLQKDDKVTEFDNACMALPFLGRRR